MKQEQVDAAMRRASVQMQDTQAERGRSPQCVAANTVHAFLTGLIEQRPGYIHRQILRTVRGLVVQWQKRMGCHPGD